MPRQSPPRSAPRDAPADIAFAVALIAIVGVLAVVWAGGALAAHFAGNSFPGGLTAAAMALVRLPHHLGRPADAWSADVRSTLPGPLVYWLSQVAVVGAAGGLAWIAWRLVPGLRDADGLGVERSARFAERRDMKRLRVRQPTPGRIILGRVDGQLVATEPRTSVCIVGPSQSGKTSGLCVPALLELDKAAGAVIAVSVKGDLHFDTIARRAGLGEVKVFDPTCVLMEKSDTWSPLRAAHSVTGAQAAARALVELAGKGGLENGDFWMASAKELLWPMFHIAARTGGTMRDVVRWVSTHDRPLRDGTGKVLRQGEISERMNALRGRIEAREARKSQDHAPTSVEKQAPGRTGRQPPPPVNGPLGELLLAENALKGIWENDERTRSSIYTTTRTVIEAWSDPVVAKASEGCDITPEWLLDGSNTLYVIAPTRDQDRFRPVFASMVADLVHAAFDVAARTKKGELDTKLLVLLDEAANICPVRQLPAWCATCPSHGITLVTVWQDRSQQRLRYGREGAETVWNNSGAKVILSGLADTATAEVTHLLGDEEYDRQGSTTEAGTGRRSVSSQTMTRRLVSEDSLRRQQPGQALLIYKDLPPMRLGLRHWKDERALRDLGAADEPVDQDAIVPSGET